MTIVGCAPTPLWHLSYSPAGVSVASSFIHALILSVWPPSLLKSPPRFSLSPSFCLFIKTTSPAGGGWGVLGVLPRVVLERLHHRRRGHYHQRTSLSDGGSASSVAPPLIFLLSGGTSLLRKQKQGLRVHRSALITAENPKSCRGSCHAGRHVSVPRRSVIVDARLDASAAARVALPSSPTLKGQMLVRNAGAADVYAQRQE